jgi:hypothetical protein
MERENMNSNKRNKKKKKVRFADESEDQPERKELNDQISETSEVEKIVKKKKGETMEEAKDRVESPPGVKEVSEEEAQTIRENSRQTGNDDNIGTERRERKKTEASVKNNEEDVAGADSDLISMDMTGQQATLALTKPYPSELKESYVQRLVELGASRTVAMSTANARKEFVAEGGSSDSVVSIPKPSLKQAQPSSFLNNASFKYISPQFSLPPKTAKFIYRLNGSLMLWKSMLNESTPVFRDQLSLLLYTIGEALKLWDKFFIIPHGEVTNSILGNQAYPAPVNSSIDWSIIIEASGGQKMALIPNDDVFREYVFQIPVPSKDRIKNFRPLDVFLDPDIREYQLFMIEQAEAFYVEPITQLPLYELLCPQMTVDYVEDRFVANQSKLIRIFYNTDSRELYRSYQINRDMFVAGTTAKLNALLPNFIHVGVDVLSDIPKVVELSSTRDSLLKKIPSDLLSSGAETAMLKFLLASLTSDLFTVQIPVSGESSIVFAIGFMLLSRMLRAELIRPKDIASGWARTLSALLKTNHRIHPMTLPTVLSKFTMSNEMQTFIQSGFRPGVVDQVMPPELNVLGEGSSLNCPSLFQANFDYDTTVEEIIEAISSLAGIVPRQNSYYVRNIVIILETVYAATGGTTIEGLTHMKAVYDMLNTSFYALNREGSNYLRTKMVIDLDPKGFAPFVLGLQSTTAIIQDSWIDEWQVFNKRNFNANLAKIIYRYLVNRIKVEGFDISKTIIFRYMAEIFRDRSGELFNLLSKYKTGGTPGYDQRIHNYLMSGDVDEYLQDIFDESISTIESNKRRFGIAEGVYYGLFPQNIDSGGIYRRNTYIEREVASYTDDELVKYTRNNSYRSILKDAALGMKNVFFDLPVGYEEREPIIDSMADISDYPIPDYGSRTEKEFAEEKFPPYTFIREVIDVEENAQTAVYEKKGLLTTHVEGEINDIYNAIRELVGQVDELKFVLKQYEMYDYIPFSNYQAYNVNYRF